MLRRLQGQVFRATKLLGQPQTVWQRRRVLDSLTSHGQRINSDTAGVIRLTLRVPYRKAGEASGPCFRAPDAPGSTDLRAMAKIAHLPALARVTLDLVVVIDTETTGLLDRPEVVPFLVGLGHFEPREFVIEQLFMEDFESELAMLTALAHCMRPFRVILTYNGKTFDLPLLRRRFAIHRLPSGTWKRPHWDILRTVRRLWHTGQSRAREQAAEVRSCSLTDIERDVLGFHRTRTIESNRIPDVYHDYLGGRRAERLAAVFDHNAQDILTTAAVATKSARWPILPVGGQEFRPTGPDAV